MQMALQAITPVKLEDKQEKKIYQPHFKRLVG